jgi:S1-C subfamily serine protease
MYISRTAGGPAECFGPGISGPEKRAIMYLEPSSVARVLRRAILALVVFFPAAYSNASALTSEETATIDAYEKVAPSVVNITTQMCEPEFFFCATPSVTGSGSGVVLRHDGLIITNNHVVTGAQNIWAVLSDGRRLAARITASDPDDDLAMIKVDPGDKPLKAIGLGDSDSLRVGEKVLAVGNPFGLGQTLTAGVVSMTDRSIKNDDTVLKNLIQTDAAINPGNSGGALINLDGELVGLCTAILSPTGVSIRIGFALPVNRIKTVAPGLMRTWQRTTGWVLAILFVVWFLRRIYGRRGQPGRR